MATGASNLSGLRIPLFDLFGVPRSSSIKEGYVVVFTSDSGDNSVVDIPTSASALLGGAAFAGISAAQGTTVAWTSTNPPGDQNITVAVKGVAKCVLKTNTACTRGQIAGYDPADGGPVQPVIPGTSGRLIPIGRFVQSKSSNAGEQFVGVDLDMAYNPTTDGLIYGILADGTHTANVNTEQTFSNGSYSIPANRLQAGTTLRIEGNLLVENQNGTDKLVARIKIGSSTIVATPASYDPATNDVVRFVASIKIRTAGAVGALVADGQMLYGTAAGTAALGSLASTVIDTTVANTVSATVQFDAASANNVCKLRRFDVFAAGMV